MKKVKIFSDFYRHILAKELEKFLNDLNGKGSIIQILYSTSPVVYSKHSGEIESDTRHSILVIYETEEGECSPANE